MFAHYSKWIPNFSERIHSFAYTTTFPLTSDQIKCFEGLKKAFLSAEVQAFLHVRGIATSRTTAYNPQGQIEKLNSTLWRTILLALKTKNLSV